MRTVHIDEHVFFFDIVAEITLFIIINDYVIAPNR